MVANATLSDSFHSARESKKVVSLSFSGYPPRRRTPNGVLRQVPAGGGLRRARTGSGVMDVADVPVNAPRKQMYDHHQDAQRDADLAAPERRRNRQQKLRRPTLELIRAQGDDGVELGRPPRGIDAEDESDERGEAEAEQSDPGLNDGGEGRNLPQ